MVDPQQNHRQDLPDFMQAELNFVSKFADKQIDDSNESAEDNFVYSLPTAKQSPEQVPFPTFD